MIGMKVHNDVSPSTHFGRQLRKERLAHKWSLREFAARTGIDFSQVSRIENGKQPPSEKVARACDEAWPERDGWFMEFYEESKSWTPAGFRNWSEIEDKAVRLRVWAPGIMHGLVQTQGYARALIDVEPAITDEVARIRLAARKERQRRVLMRPGDPPTAWFIIDEVALYRRVGSAEIMAGQLDHLLEVAALPWVTVTVMPAVAHPANASELIIVDDSAAYVEHLIGGFTYVEDVTVSAASTRFDTLRGECYRVSESLALIKEMHEQWTAGVSPLTRAATAGPALKSRQRT
jgi:transcriptional regulator with XRE-family HTH domain